MYLFSMLAKIYIWKSRCYDCDEPAREAERLMKKGDEAGFAYVS